VARHRPKIGLPSRQRLGDPIYRRSIMRNPIPHLLLASSIAAIIGLAMTGYSFAGQCPPDKVTTSGQVAGPAKHTGVTDKVLTMIPLAQEKVALKEHALRLRRLVVQPGGIVAWHSHADRPAIIYVVSGSITEYTTHCRVPIVHRAGETSTEAGGLSHWWKNHTRRPVVLLSADLLHDMHDHNM
jgi:quercetin dioxygenase-like cupin family protein